jgi:PhzF family phenazine biosynthesis protein
MGQEIFQVDAFTDRPFAGNPAGVCVLPRSQDDGWMQNVAKEMNLSETAFLLRQDDGSYNLRWFTPATEVPLCGHATLASAYVLWERGYLKLEETARFHTLSGLLTAKRAGEWIELDFPMQVPSESEIPADLITALGIKPKYVGETHRNYLVELDSEEIVRNLQPDYSLLKTLPVQGVIVTSKATIPEYDFVSRYFAPNVGIDEDPVTGSAHCCLAPYWRDRLKKDNFLAYQASARGGVIKVTCKGDRVLLGGQAVMVLQGELI